MRITWVTRSFLDYRIPLYAALDQLSGNQLTVIFNAEVVPQRCQDKLRVILGERAIGLTGELRLTGKKMQPVSERKKQGIRIPVQPKLIDTVRQTQPEVILSDGFFQWTYAAVYLNAINNIPHIMCYEGTEHTERNVGQLRTAFRRLMSRYMNLIHANGNLSATYLKEKLNISESKIELGNMTADSNRLAQHVKDFGDIDKNALKASLHLNSKVFLYVGRLVPIKGLSYLLEVWREFATFDASLLIVGDGMDMEDLKQSVKSFQLDNVVFTGAVNYDDIYKYFAIADMFVIPTLQDNWSLVVPEAMSCGLPILCSKYNGCWPELVTPENGWVFDPLDPDHMLKTLKDAIAKKDQWPVMDEASKRIVAKYSPERIATSIFESCKSLCE